ncbi:dedicator of cytokinesis protein 5-like, partial [Diaphorina citri]|uniref:Dedicator of cytokinesis protein 5-like n=1 Tax=Diaphorina citri TaxID=121845 RepID=A0A3Q0JK80_DIACI
MNKLTPPGEEITESSGQYVQINKVDPIMCAEDQRKFADKPISEQIIRYYRCNRVQKFKYS